PIVPVIIGLIVIILIFQRTKQDYSLPIGLIILICTLGGVLLVPDSFEYYNLIFPSGCAIVGLFLVFYMIRNSKRHYILYFELAIVILALAGAVVLPEFATIIIAISLVLIGILTFIKGF
ncbi:MAG: hypothetical protein ACFE9L_21000, partial [Candidatus Hodarchaeota archaeon]